MLGIFVSSAFEALAAKIARSATGLIMACALALLAQGCALSPGMNYSREFAAEPSVQQSALLGDYLREVLGLDSEDPPPPGALIPITPDLIRKQRQAAGAGVPAEVASLFAAPSA